MKTIAVFFAVVAVAFAAPQFDQYQQQQQQQQQQQVVLLKQTPLDNIGLGNYRYGFELSDGQKRDESAQVETRHIDNEEVPVLRVHGSYSFVGQDGQTYTVTYVADENGFQPQGAHLPVSSA